MTKQDQNLEVEVKFPAPDLRALRERLLALGATVTAPRILERNVVFDNDRRGLRQHEQILRLRRDTRVRLTFKGLPQEERLSDARVREELELEVSDFETMVLILKRLGFSAVQVYEKYRESFSLDGVGIVLDELPFGSFVELEGDDDAIRDLALRLGLDWERRVLDSYIALMAILKEHHQLPFDDLTFANFPEQQPSIIDMLG